MSGVVPNTFQKRYVTPCPRVVLQVVGSIRASLPRDVACACICVLGDCSVEALGLHSPRPPASRRAVGDSSRSPRRPNNNVGSRASFIVVAGAPSVSSASVGPSLPGLPHDPTYNWQALTRHVKFVSKQRKLGLPLTRNESRIVAEAEPYRSPRQVKICSTFTDSFTSESRSDANVFTVSVEDEEAEEALLEIDEFESAHVCLPKIIRTRQRLKALQGQPAADDGSVDEEIWQKP